MSLWMIVLLLGVIKLPIAALMLWLPFRGDEAMRAPADVGSADEDGGSLTVPGDPGGPRPRLPGRGPWLVGGSPHGPRDLRRTPARARRGAHGTPAPRSPRRVRTAAMSRRHVSL